MNVAVIIPCFRVTKHIKDLITRIGDDVALIVIVDDCCPDKTGDFVEQNCDDERIHVLRHDNNQGVGAAVKAGWQYAVNQEMDICIKMDGDGQMDPAWIGGLIQPIVNAKADYVKGNRFFDLKSLKAMPAKRLIGNAILSFFAKLSTGYWSIFDPNNGFVAIHRTALQKLELDSVSNRYFFESDILMRLNIVKAVVVEYPHKAVYDDEVSNMKLLSIIPEFLIKHVRNTLKRLFYNYFLRGMSVASFNLIGSFVLLTVSLGIGVPAWLDSAQTGLPATAGTVMLAAMPVIVSIQMLLSFLDYDVRNEPKEPLLNIYEK